VTATRHGPDGFGMGRGRFVSLVATSDRNTQRHTASSRLRRRVSVAVATATSLATVLSVGTGDAAAQDVVRCTEQSPEGYCVYWELASARPVNGSGTRGGSVVCIWTIMPSDLSDDPTVWNDFGLDRPPEGISVVWQDRSCSDGSSEPGLRWVIPATRANLAAIARGRIARDFAAPSVATTPAEGVAAIVGVPVFVAVTNWTGVVSDASCAGGMCVTVTAEPQLVVGSGEPGSGPLRCSGPGSVYSPRQGAPADQAAAPGVCALVYQRRTGIEGRPEAWLGSVSVTWTVTWTSSTGDAGVLVPVTLSAALPRAVEEVQTVLVGGQTP
jgi:hypothetical protein